jgi:hypothetical protein
MSERGRAVRRRSDRLRTEIFSAAAAIAAVFAPSSLTGFAVIDAAERALIAGFVTFVGAHGRRWAWLAAAVAVVIPARGTSLALALAALAVLAACAIPRRRPRGWGAAGLGLMANAVLWYPESATPWGAVVAIVAMALVVGSGFPHMRRTRRRAAVGTLIAVAALVVIAGIASLVAIGLSYGHVQDGASSARRALDAARDGNAEVATRELDAARSSFDAASSRLNGPLTVPAEFVPGLAQQVQAVQTTVDQGETIAATADDLVATADYDRLQYVRRLDLAQVEELADPTARADVALGQARRELAEVQRSWLLPPLRDKVDQFADDIDEARTDTSLAAAILKETPGLFGADGSRRYLVVFVTPAELRGAGGFIGSYAELEVEAGKATLTRSGRIDDLLEAPGAEARTLSGPSDYLARYGRFDPPRFLQDVTYSPHFPSDASAIAELYPQAGGSEVDGVIAVDPKGLAALLQLTGPVTVDGLPQPLSSENAADILTRSQYLDLGDRAARGEVLAEATRATFEELINSALPAPRKLADTLSPAARGGHLRLWSPDRGEQRLFERLGADGSLTVPRGADGFSVVQQNAGNNKIDAYLARTIRYEPTVDASTGKLRATKTITMKNDVPFAPLPPAVTGNTRGAPDGTNVTTLSLFTPNVVTKATIDGQTLTMGPSTERGLNAWDTPQFSIPPGKTVTIVIELEGGVDLSHGYRLHVLPQPVAIPDRFSGTLTVEEGTVKRTGEHEEDLFEDDPLEAPTTVRVPVAG